MNTFESELKTKIRGAKNCKPNTSVLFLEVAGMVKFNDPFCKIMKQEGIKDMLTGFVIFHWYDTEKGLVDVYNVHEDYIKLILKLSNTDHVYTLEEIFQWGL